MTSATEPLPRRRRMTTATALPRIDERVDWPYTFDILPLEDMWLARYQRPSTSFVQRIVANYDPAQVGTLIVSERGRGRKTHSIVDGKSRREAMLQIGESEA